MDKETLRKAALTRYPNPIQEELFYKNTKEEKKEKIASHIKAIMEILGLDLSHNSLRKTPERVARMYVEEIFSGLDYEAFPSISLFEQEEGVSKIGNIIVTKVSLVSFCEHHLVPMIGSAHIGYIPHDKILGLSKISRIARYFAARPQLQERLSAQIGDSLSTILGHTDVIVLVTAQHSCVLARGAKDETSTTTTLYTGGLFESSSEYRTEFLRITERNAL